MSPTLKRSLENQQSNFISFIKRKTQIFGDFAEECPNTRCSRFQCLSIHALKWSGSPQGRGPHILSPPHPGWVSMQYRLNEAEPIKILTGNLIYWLAVGPAFRALVWIFIVFRYFIIPYWDGIDFKSKPSPLLVHSEKLFNLELGSQVDSTLEKVGR